MQKVWIVDSIRTAMGRQGGGLKSIRPDDLAAQVIRALVSRTGISGHSIDDVFFGCANQAGEDNRNVARMAVLLAGLPETVPGVTVNRLCASGLEAVNQAARAIAIGEMDMAIAGGVESMTRAPLVLQKPSTEFVRGNQTLWDTTLGWRMGNPAFPYPLESMGDTAENVAEQYGISRFDQDSFAFSSQQKAATAQRTGVFAEEIVPITVSGPRGMVSIVSEDEHLRPETTHESLASLPPIFRPGGTVTAGNSSGINDGAAALLLVSEERGRQLGLQPLARYVSSAAAGVSPRLMGLGPVPATRKVLERAGLVVGDLDVVELNEAFASQSLACIQELGLDPLRVNPNGGAIALGHPLGCSGTRILGSLARQLRRTGSRYGLATLCVGVGQGVATLIEQIPESHR